MNMTIALAGNPNSGKTTLFNSLTGMNQYVGNWPGVTVEKKEGKLKGHREVTIQDLPGVYSLSPYTPEEIVTRNYLVNHRPDAIINILDGTNLERNLYLTTQLLELGIPVVVLVNMMDLVEKSGDIIDPDQLSKDLGCPVLLASALKGAGAREAAELAVFLAGEKQQVKPPPVFNGSLAPAIARIKESIKSEVDPELTGWYAVKLFEGDEIVQKELHLAPGIMEQLNGEINAWEEEMDDDAAGIITNQRYAYISGVAGRSVKKKNRGVKMNVSDRIDRVVTNRILAIPVFALIMFLVYYISISTVGDLVTGWTNDVLFGEIVSGNVSAWLAGMQVSPWLSGLIVDGVIGGVGAVLGFIPQMAVLFLMLSLLEEAGYMARVAFIMDRVFRRVGLSGKSFIPMLIGSGCSVPGIMASRTIESERDRRMSIMTTSFIPCGAKMPVIALFAGALFSGSGLVATSAYFIGVAAVITSGIILKKSKPFAGAAAPFVMELPAYHMPRAETILRATWERVSGFARRAGTVILLSAIVLWFLQSFGFAGGALVMVDDNNTSLLADLGKGLAFLFVPLGFGTWKAAVATMTGFIAKENVVGTFGVLYGFGAVSENGAEVWSALASDFTGLTAYSFMIFNLLCAPCFAAMGAIRREMNHGKWTWAAISYMTVFAYGVSLMVYQFGLFFTGHGFGPGTAAAFAVFGVFLWLLLRPVPIKKEYAGAYPALSKQ